MNRDDFEHFYGDVKFVIQDQHDDLRLLTPNHETILDPDGQVAVWRALWEGYVREWESSSRVTHKGYTVVYSRSARRLQVEAGGLTAVLDLEGAAEQEILNNLHWHAMRKLGDPEVWAVFEKRKAEERERERRIAQDKTFDDSEGLHRALREMGRADESGEADKPVPDLPPQTGQEQPRAEETFILKLDPEGVIATDQDPGAAGEETFVLKLDPEGGAG